MATTSGIGSNFIDVSSIVSQLMTIERRPLTLLQSKESSLTAKVSAYGTLKSGLSTFQSAMNGLGDLDKFKVFSATSSDDTVLTATASSTASAGSHTVEVVRYAEQHKLFSSSSFAETDTLAASTTATISVGGGGKMKSRLITICTVLLVVGLLLVGCMPPPAAPAQPAAQPAEPTAQPAEPTAKPAEPAAAKQAVSVVHYFSDTLGKETITGIFNQFTKDSGIGVVDNTTGHEDFKAQILVMLAGDNPPDTFSYWAGARTQFVADSERLEPIDALWDANKLGDVVPPALAAKATMYNGKRYLIPFGYHYAGMFYNPKVMAEGRDHRVPHHLG